MLLLLVSLYMRNWMGFLLVLRYLTRASWWKKKGKKIDDDEGVSSWLQRFKKMGKRDGDARRMLTEVSGSPAVAPIKSIHQYFSFSLGAGRMRVGFLVPKKKKIGRNKKRVEREARISFDCRSSGDLWITLGLFFFKKNRQKFPNFMTTPPWNPFIFSRKKKKKKIIIYYYKMKSIWWVGGVCFSFNFLTNKKRSNKLFVHIH